MKKYSFAILFLLGFTCFIKADEGEPVNKHIPGDTLRAKTTSPDAMVICSFPVTNITFPSSPTACDGSITFSIPTSCGAGPPYKAVSGGTCPTGPILGMLPPSFTVTGLCSCNGNYVFAFYDANSNLVGFSPACAIPYIPVISITDSIIQAVCYGSNNSKVSLSPSGGTRPYTYNWSPYGGTDSVATGLSPGTFTCSVTDSNSPTRTVTYSVTIPALALITSSQNLTLCAGQNVTVGTNTYTASGTYTDTLTSFKGCDSIVTSTINVLPLISGTQNISICKGDSILLAGTYENTPGVYTDTLLSHQGCDSILNITLAITIVDTLLMQNGNTFTAHAAGAIYQWIDCGNGSLINGATAQNYTATQNGSYALIINQNNCTDTSACVSVNLVGIQTAAFSETGIQLYPNPNRGHFIIALNNSTQISIDNTFGKTIFNELVPAGKKEFDLSIYPKGIYLLKATNNNTIQQMLKIVID